MPEIPKCTFKFWNIAASFFLMCPLFEFLLFYTIQLLATSGNIFIIKNVFYFKGIIPFSALRMSLL